MNNPTSNKKCIHGFTFWLSYSAYAQAFTLNSLPNINPRINIVPKQKLARISITVPETTLHAMDQKLSSSTMKAARKPLST